jgi:phage repressor protein C with HTH and peptisase S24 domain
MQILAGKQIIAGSPGQLFGSWHILPARWARMLSHEAVWGAIDALAQMHRMTPSGLARKSGLDPTSFNRSKRITPSGRPRWPSTESIAKALKATDTPLETFMELVMDSGPAPAARRPSVKYSARPSAVPLLGSAQAGVGGFFDDGGYPAGQGWDEIRFPDTGDENVYGLKVSGDSMLPLYRSGDVLIVAPGATIRKGDRVVVRTRSGEVMAKLLARKTPRQVELKSVNPDHPDRIIPSSEIDWIARIIWASQ